MPATLIVLATCLAYAGSFGGRYQIDDQHVIVENLGIRDLGHAFGEIGASTRSLVNFTFALNYACHGLDVWGFHLVNLLVHLAATLCLHAWLRSVVPQGAARLAFLIALIFGVHPLTTQSVTYITQRYSSMAGMFFFACLWLWGRYRARGQWAWYVLCLASAGAAMLCKEMAVAIPVAVIVADLALHQRDDGKAAALRIGARWKAYLPLAAMLAVVPALNLVSHDYALSQLGESLNWAGKLDITRWEYFLTQVRLVVLTYLRLMVFPVGQSVDHSVFIVRNAAEPATVAATAVLLIALLVSVYGAFLRPERRYRLAGFGGLLFFMGLAATSTVVPNSAFVQEQRLYVSLAGYLVVVCTAVWSLPLHRFLATAILSAAAVVLGVLTHERNQVWHSESVVWQDAVNNAPHSPRAHNNLALALADSGQIERAIAHYCEAIRLNPRYAIAYSNLGNILFRQDRVGEATRLYAEAVRLAPDYADGHNNLAAALERSGRFSEAIVHCRRAIEIEPDSADAHNNLGNALSGAGDLGAALVHYRTAIDIYGRLAETKHRAIAHNNLANALVRLDRRHEALAHYREALRLDPGYQDARRNLANLDAAAP